MAKEYLALFDLDGTLFDTGDVNYYAYKEALTPFNVELDKEYFVNKCNGRHYTEFLPQIMGTYEHMDEVHKLKKSAYANNLDKARVNHHLFEIIMQMKEKYHLAVVTTASRQNATDILKYYNYYDIFEFMVTQEDITRIKPDPEGFILAMNHFEIDAKNTVIFEDSEVGIQAAKATGATVFVIGQL
ncbi:MAG: HAD-IA family hydrolase [Lachnospiraceae bacterium]|nr:HAD-IA family hydrolase [Lachnospiraceae bacterium]